MLTAVHCTETIINKKKKKKKKKLTMGRAVTFCQRLEDCPKIYRFFRTALGLMFTYPAGSPDICDNRLVDMFHSCTESCIKEKIIKAFTSDLSPLRVVIATTAFGMGIDVPNIRTIIHLGGCEDVETYVQAIHTAFMLTCAYCNRSIDMCGCNLVRVVDTYLT